MNLCMTEVYLLSLVVIFIASLGNRPQGSKVLYTICFVLFATIMALLLFFSFWSVYQTIVLAQSTGTISVLLKQSYFRDLIISIGSTYGMYFLASFAHREPWHMVKKIVSEIERDSGE